MAKPKKNVRILVRTIGKKKTKANAWFRSATPGARKRKRAQTRLLREKNATPNERIRKSLNRILSSRKTTRQKPISKLWTECKSSAPDKKAVLKAWSQGARFNHDLGQSDPGMYLSSLQRARSELSNKNWLWDAMAREGADLAQTDHEGLGFEARAIQEGNAQALLWWKNKGFDLSRRTKKGLSLWILAFKENALMIPVMAKIWPEAADPQEISIELRAWIQTRGQEIQSLEARMRLIDNIRGWPSALEALPEATPPSDELSAFMRSIPASGESVEAVRRLEQAAIARFERAELSISSQSEIKKSTTQSKSL